MRQVDETGCRERGRDAWTHHCQAVAEVDAQASSEKLETSKACFRIEFALV